MELRHAIQMSYSITCCSLHDSLGSLYDPLSFGRVIVMVDSLYSIELQSHQCLAPAALESS